MSSRLLNYFPKGVFARHVVTLMTGTILSGALGIFVMPVLTRMYKPEDFGIFALYTSLLGLLSVVVCGRYEMALVLPEKDEDSANLLLLCLIICFFMSAFTLLLVVIFRTSLARMLSAPALAPWLYILPVSLVAFGIFRILNYWSTRRKHYKRLAARQITQSSVTAASQIGAGFICSSTNVGGLIGGSIAGQVFASGILAWQVERDEGRFIRQSLTRSSLIRVAKRYRNFPLFDIWSAFLNSASTMLPALLLGYFFSPIVVGFYALGFQILAVPMGIMGSSIAQVFFPHANEAKRNGQLDQLVLKIFNRLLSVGFVPFLLITIVAPDLFALVFGARWFTAGEYLRWLSVWLLFVFIASPLSNIYAIMEKQREGLIVNIVIFSSRLIVLIVGGIKGNALFAIALFGITGALLWIFNCIYIQYLAGVATSRILVAIMQQILYGMPYALLPLLIYWITDNSIAFVIASVTMGGVFVIVHFFKMRKDRVLL